MKSLPFLRSLSWLGLIGLSLWWRYGLYYLFPHQIAVDSHFYDTSATNIASGKGFSLAENGIYYPVTHHTPGYSLILSAIYRIIPDNSFLTAQSPRVIAVVVFQQALLIMSIYWYAMMLHALIKRRRVATLFFIAGLFYVPWTGFSFMMLSETVSLFFLAFISWLTFFRKTPPLFRQFFVGCLMGYLVLIKPYFLYVPVVYGVWSRWWQSHLKLTKIEWLLCGSGLLLVIGAWLGRSYWLTKQVIPLQRGYAFVTSTAACPYEVCHAQGSLMQKIDKAAPLNPQERQPAQPLEVVWWHLIAKQRLFWGKPDGFTLFRDVDFPGKDLWLYWGTGFYYFAWIGLFIRMILPLKLHAIERWWMALIVGASVMHGYVWSLPRYAVALIPLVILLGIRGWIGLIRHKKTLQINRYVVTAGLISFILSFFLPSGYATTLWSTLAIVIAWLGVSYYLFQRVIRERKEINRGWRFAVALYLSVMILVMWPSGLESLIPGFSWEHLPFPFVMRVGNTIIK